MENIDIKNKIALRDLVYLVEECAKQKISLDTPVMIAQHKDEMISNATHILADNESINIYDWI